MTLRKTEIIEWSTTPAELRRIANELEMPPTKAVLAITRGDMRLTILFNEDQWQAEQVERKE